MDDYITRIYRKYGLPTPRRVNISLFPTPIKYKVKTMREAREADREAIASDWSRVGDSIGNILESDELELSKSNNKK